MNGNKKVITVSVDGNIGAGKSTLLLSLKSNKILVISEPVEDWKFLLAKVSQDPKKYIFSLQMEILKHFSSVKDFINDNIKRTDINYIIVERSVESSISIFSKTFLDMGYLSNQDYNTLQQISAKSHTNFDFRILIKTNVDICIERILERGRNFEKVLKQDYLKSLEVYQNHLYDSFKQSEKYIIDGNQSKDKVLQSFKSFFNFKDQ